MDPLSALSIAATVAQFLQFAGSLVSKSQEIYAEGALGDHVECESATKRLDILAEEVQSSLGELGSLGKLSKDAEALRVICVRCSKLSEELISRLNELRVDGKHRRWKSFRQALKSVCTNDKIEGIASQLDSCKAELSQHLIASIRRKTDSLALQQEDIVKAIEENANATIAAILESQENLRKDLREQQINLSHLEVRDQIPFPSALVSIGEAQSVEIHLLLSLRFSSMRDRQAEIPVAHQKTFRWILKNPSNGEDVPWSSFIDWLKSVEGIYWVSGKAGSGKSTLMRYIFENPETRKHLEVWAGENRLESLGFFFWNGGSLEQRSQCGLLRSLLYQSLYKRPNLVREIFPKEVTKNNSLLAHAEEERWNWSLPALKQAFERWVNLALKSSMNLCLFLDGLDEYEGDHESIVEFFKGISASHPSRIKLCISGRPWVVFDEAFRGLPKLHLQDLTYGDIEAYVQDELRSHRRMLQLAKAEPIHAHDLVTEIVTKASGVFLWVMLIIRSLLSGLQNRDDITVLRKRLRHLPADLSSLYTHMLNHVDPIYNEQASQAFQIYSALSSESSESENGAVTALELSLAITATLHNQSSIITPMTDDEVKVKCENLDVHLKSRCAGLLEIHPETPRTWGSHKYFDPVKPTHKVNYLHRTVKDFLATEDVREKLLADCISDFNPHTNVIHSCVSRLYRSVFITHIGNMYPASNEAVWAMIIRAMKYAKRADISGDSSYVSALNKLAQAGIQAWDFQLDPWKGEHKLPIFLENTTLPWKKCDKILMWMRNFDGEPITYKLQAYVSSEVRENKVLLQNRETMPMFSYLFENNTRYSVDVQVPSPQIADLLLRQGADPSQRWLGENMWRKTLNAIRTYNIDLIEHSRSKGEKYVKELSQDQRRDLTGLAEILQLLFQYNEDTADDALTYEGRRISSRKINAYDIVALQDIIALVYDLYLPSISAELSHALEAKIARDSRSDATNGIKRRHEEEDSYGPRKRFQWSNRPAYQR